jgi:hypothetical protein
MRATLAEQCGRRTNQIPHWERRLQRDHVFLAESSGEEAMPAFTAGRSVELAELIHCSANTSKAGRQARWLFLLGRDHLRIRLILSTWGESMQVGFP